jgi:hypothetical protein
MGVISGRDITTEGRNYKIDVFIRQNIPAKDFKTISIRDFFTRAK